MRLLSFLPQALLLFSTLSSAAAAASTWTFADASLTVTSKGTAAGKDGGIKEKLTPSQPLSKPIPLGSSDTLKITLATQEGKSAKRPHQAFLLLQDQEGKLDVSYPFSVKESGKAKVELTHKDLPVQFLTSSTSSNTSGLSASIVIASFSTTPGYNSPAFILEIKTDPNTPLPPAEKSLRYGKLPEIHHIFRSDPRSPPVVISLVFLAAVVGTLPLLAGAWVALGLNLSSLPKAFSASPISHACFASSIAGIEFVFFLYYTTWNLFQTLPVLGALAVVAFLSGSRALTEVQERRLAGTR
ncbi:uncharacterized protein A1O5_06093 [Cladophialophora psammophila CBS 110553]|uniref:Ribophorin II C-terminal domain-containing protein n=1 Tax=Cladophialophora psammophila CBS 110553 TaxID=1182543 RepID=W9X1A3_9EURO|nr:uncharacterized protein A1O5_06093 [Cladophialophora psammophila CBS 110553]EXJ71100.1 hypothetical protein A1O5_06093 [Cladophialophora psammophila CBS 110553]